MVPITRDDEELFGTVLLAARLGRAGAIVESLRTRYDREWDDPLAGFPYALAMLAVLRSGRDEFGEKTDYTEIVETLSDLLYHQPDHWLGRYLRIHVRSLLPLEAEEHRHYIAAERGRAIEDVRELIERQKGTAWQPWFACAYVSAARLAWEADDGDPEPVAALVAEAAARTAAPIPFRTLGSVLCEVFRWYQDRPGLPRRDTVGAMMGVLFPDQPTVRGLVSDRVPDRSA